MMPPIPPELAALTWVPGCGPIAWEPLAGGLVNDTWRVERGGRRYSLRRSREDCADLGLDRVWECHVLGQAAAAGLAPAVVHCAPGEGLLICEWIGGVAWSADEARAPSSSRALADVLRRVHALRVPRPVRAMSPRTWLDHYAAAARRRRLPVTRRSVALQGTAARCLDRLATLPAGPPVLCHGDLHRLNVSIADRTVLLDWEYAHVAEPLWDLAGWVCNNDADATVAVGFLAHYFGRPAMRHELDRLEMLRWLFDYVCLVWSELYSSRPGVDDAAAAGVTERARTLAGRLEATAAAATGGSAAKVPAH